MRLLPAASLLVSLAACGDPSEDRPTTTTTSTTAPDPTSTGSSTAPTSTSASAATDTTTETSSSETTLDPDPSTSSTTSSTSSTTSSTSDTSTSSSGTSSDTGFSGQELRVLQLNLCHSGIAGCFTGDAVMQKAVDVITDVAPGIVTLNEVCRADVPWLAGQTGAVDHRFTPALKADDTPVKCKNGDDYGNGLLAWYDPAWADPVTGVYAAQSSMTERRVWICMGYEPFVGCTTHLSTNGDTALAQCHELVDGPLATAAAAGPALMAGDWNLHYKGNPDAQDCVARAFYRKGDGTLQHVIASDDLAFLETIVLDMDGTTDHPALEVRLTLP